MVRQKILKHAAEFFEAAEEDLELVDGEVRIKVVPQKTISLGELAGKANPMRGAVRPGTEPGLEATEYFGPERGATASGIHAMIVEVDPETGQAPRHKFYDMAAAEKALVVGFHFTFPSIGYVEKDGSKYRLVPVAWNRPAR